jgi:hypothetical protein
MTAAISSILPENTASPGASAQVAVLQRQLVALEKQLTAAQKTQDATAAANQAQLISQLIGLLQAQIAQLQQPVVQVAARTAPVVDPASRAEAANLTPAQAAEPAAVDHGTVAADEALGAYLDVYT